MRVLLVQHDSGLNPFVKSSGIAEPLAYEILAATISHHDVKILDMRIDKTPLVKEMEAFQPDVVGVGCVTASYYGCVNLLKEVKQIDSSIYTVVGGHHPTVKPKDFIGNFTDYLVFGEGDETFRELIDSLECKGSISDIKGIGIIKNGNLHISEDRPLIDINAMPFPNRKLTSHYRKNYFRGTWRPITSIVSSRGCSFRCKFCCQWILNRGTYRARSPEKIVEELSQIQEKYIDFIDDNSWENTRWIEELYLRIKEAGLKKNFKLCARSDLIIRRPDLIEKWRNIGLKLVLIGFESFRDEDLNKWNKKNTINNNIKAAQILKDNDIDIIAYFLIDPSYTEYDFLRMQEHAKELDILQPIFSILTPFPGTKLYDEVKDSIITDNYEYFDGMHALTTTFLPTQKFYKLYADLYLKAYPKSKLLKNILLGKMSFSLRQSYAQMKYLRQLGPVDG